MVFFNYATMQMAAKIVYYGPGLCGKTTNLHHIYAKTSPQSRGEMVSLETETDRTLFFDLLPIDVGVIGGFKTRLQLYTVPGQVFYNTTRKLVLKGVDGMVFVADSQRAMLEANVESFKNLRENLAEIGTNIDELPLVIQLNKRDLPNIADVDTILNALDPERRAEHVESIASTGVGVFETLKSISKLTLRTLRRRMTGDEPARPGTSRSGAHFRVQDNSRTVAGSTPLPSPSPSFVTSASTIAAPAAEELNAVIAAEAFDPDATVAASSLRRNLLTNAPVPDLETPPVEASPVAEERIAEPVDAVETLEPPPSFETGTVPVAEPEPEPETADETPLAGEPPTEEPEPEAPAATSTIPSTWIGEAPVEAPAEVPAEVPAETPAEAVEHPAEAVEAAVEPAAPPILDEVLAAAPPEPFTPPASGPEAEPEVKTVKVRTSVDVMAELEALRKRATNTTAKAPRRDVLADLASLRPKRDLNRTLHLQLPADVVSRTKRVRVTLSFEDGEDGVIDTQEQQLELNDTTDVQSLSVNLKIDLA